MINVNQSEGETTTLPVGESVTWKMIRDAYVAYHEDHKKVLALIEEAKRPEFDNSYTAWKPMREKEDERIY
jgi:carbonic anhydrase